MGRGISKRTEINHSEIINAYEKEKDAIKKLGILSEYVWKSYYVMMAAKSTRYSEIRVRQVINEYEKIQQEILQREIED